MWTRIKPPKEFKSINSKLEFLLAIEANQLSASSRPSGGWWQWTVDSGTVCPILEAIEENRIYFSTKVGTYIHISYAGDGAGSAYYLLLTEPEYV